MSTALPPAAEPKVLVVHVNFAVGSALAQRLLESSVISLASVPAALDGALADGAHDVLILCPYLRAAERDALLERVAGFAVAPVVIQLSPTLGATVTQGRRHMPAA